jgi:hypothetical protein
MAQRPCRKLQPLRTDQHAMVDDSSEASTLWSKSMDANVLRIARRRGMRGPGFYALGAAISECVATTNVGK